MRAGFPAGGFTFRVAGDIVFGEAFGIVRLTADVDGEIAARAESLEVDRVFVAAISHGDVFVTAETHQIPSLWGEVVKKFTSPG